MSSAARSFSLETPNNHTTTNPAHARLSIIVKPIDWSKSAHNEWKNKFNNCLNNKFNNCLNNKFTPSVFGHCVNSSGIVSCFGLRFHFFPSEATFSQKNTSVQNNHLRFHTMASTRWCAVISCYYCLNIHGLNHPKKHFITFWHFIKEAAHPDFYWPTTEVS